MSTIHFRSTARLLAASVGVAALSSLSLAQCPARPWQTMGDIPGVYGQVREVTEWDPDGPGPQQSLLVVVGELRAAGTRLVNNIATWDGQEWSTLGIGLPRRSSSQYGSASSLLVHNGQLFASGYQLADEHDQPLGPVMRWTGAHWENVGQLDGASGGAMVEFNGGIAAAIWTYTGAEWIPHVRWWDGAAWQDLGPFEGGDSAIYDLALVNGSLVAAGNFATANAVPCHGLARWTDSAWEDMGLPTGAICFSIAATSTDLVASEEVRSGTSFAFHIVRRVGDSWVDVPGPLGVPCPDSGYVFALGEDMYATSSSGCSGLDGVFRLAGSQWEAVGTSLRGAVTLTRFRGQLVVGGSMQDIDQRGGAGVAAWDGVTWRALNRGMSGDYLGQGIRVNGSEILASGVEQTTRLARRSCGGMGAAGIGC